MNRYPFSSKIYSFIKNLVLWLKQHISYYWNTKIEYNYTNFNTN